ncbi:MBL fold metallo-hydrolase [Roseateles sp. PN1]|uniref:MBL fold metallo-hydrolase n=1 Tax=Roseateles sp. PN1 TaxID=3137372 RepID=UPI00313A2685
MKQSLQFTFVAALCSAAWAGAYSSPVNTVTQYQGQPVNAQQILVAGERFRNVYASPKQFPITCSEDCYAPDPRVKCERHAENCQVQWSALPAKFGWQLQWVGHASFRLLTADGDLLLLDPVSNGFDWPINWLGAIVGSRRSAPSHRRLAQDEVPSAVFYSHAHYDHYNRADLKKLPPQTRLFVPMGMAEYLPQQGYQVHEMAWYSQHRVDKLSLHFVPAHHFTGRNMYEIDGDKSLWGGWIIESGEHKLFFAGDTGYSPIFQDIRKKYGAMSTCLLPIGSYHGDNYRNAHLAPEDALKVAQELGCERMIPWGYGNHSWLMGDKSSHSALLRLLSMHRQLKSAIQVQVLNEGEIVWF